MVRHQGGELDMKVSREPVVGLESVHDVPGRWGAQSALVYVVLEVFLVAEQPVQVAVIVHLPRPVVAEHDVGRVVLQLLQPEHLEVPDVVS